MKKKEFKKPTVEVRQLETTAILAGSAQGTSTAKLTQSTTTFNFN